MKQRKKIVMLPSEKPVVGFEDYYTVSNVGKVFSKDRVVKRNGYEYIRKGKELKLSTTNLGYKTVGLTLNGKTITKYVHRLVAESFLSNPHNKPQINHLNGNKTDNSVSNLEWCTHSENMRHACNNGLTTNTFYKHEKGEKNPNSKLTKKQVEEIRNRYIPRKYSVAKLAREYGVSSSCIYHIINETSWSKNTK